MPCGLRIPLARAIKKKISNMTDKVIRTVRALSVLAECA